VNNTGTIDAAGGEVMITAATGKKLVENLIQIKGEILTPSVSERAGNTRVDSASVITANATTKGNGGKIIVWSDDRTDFHGRIEAKGGAHEGNGGFVEVSGKEKLSYAGEVDTSAPKGKAGTLLLDPKNITISAAGDIAPATITAALSANHVVIHTKDSGTADSGDITVSENVTYNSGNSLTLLATRHINANANVQNAGTGAVNLVAGWNETTSDPGGLAGAAVNAGGAFNIAAITGNAASYGNNNGSIYINRSTGTQGVAVGSRSGNVYVAGYDIILQGGDSDNEYAQIGHPDDADSTTHVIVIPIYNYLCYKVV
jgi:hypothetical protein